MAYKKTAKRRKTKITLTSVITILVAAVLFISYGKNCGLNIADWDDIGTATQIYDSVDGDFSVHFLDVGKADAIYINCGKHNVLIDAGEDTTSRQVNKYMQRLDVTSLDLVIATHPDKDHIGGMQHIIEDFPIDVFWQPEMDKSVLPDTKVYARMTEALDEYNVNCEYKMAGDSLEIGDMTVDVISPTQKYDDTNDSSLVVKITYGKTKFLFMGDASKAVEKDLLEIGANVSADVIKLGHHGSKTSSREEFLQRVNPEVAVISVGPDKNNLPSDEVLEILSDLTIPFYRTDIYGNVVVSSDGKSISVSTQK